MTTELANWKIQYDLRVQRREVVFQWDCACGQGIDYIYTVGHVFDAKDFIYSGWTINADGVRCPSCSKKISVHPSAAAPPPESPAS